MTSVRSGLAWLAGGVLLALVLNVCMAAWSFTRPTAATTPAPSDTGWPSPFVRPSPSPSVSPSPAPSAVSPLNTTPLGALPEDHVFVFIGDPGDQRLIMLDLGAGTVREAAHTAVASADTEYQSAASADGSTIAIVARSSGPDGRLHVLRPATGELTTYRIPRAETPRLSPDGRFVAMTRVEADQRGIWLADTTNGKVTSLMPDPTGPTPPRALGWSADGKRLAVDLDANSAEPRIVIVSLDGSVDRIGPGRGARWRANELIYWTALKGRSVSVYDTTARGAKPLFALDAATVVYSVEPRPRSTDLAVLEGDEATTRLVLRSGDNVTEVLRDATHLITYWWSKDGAHLYAWIDDQYTETVREPLVGRDVLRFCLRKTLTPPCG